MPKSLTSLPNSAEFKRSMEMLFDGTTTQWNFEPNYKSHSNPNDGSDTDSEATVSSSAPQLSKRKERQQGKERYCGKARWWSLQMRYCCWVPLYISRLYFCPYNPLWFSSRNSALSSVPGTATVSQRPHHDGGGKGGSSVEIKETLPYDGRLDTYWFIHRREE